MVLSVTWADDPSTSVGAISRWWLNLALFPVVYSALRDREAVRRLFCLFVIGALVSSIAGLVLGGTGAAVDPSGDDARLGGTGLNPNELGQLLIVSAVLSVLLLVVLVLRRPRVARGARGMPLAVLGGGAAVAAVVAATAFALVVPRVSAAQEERIHRGWYEAQNRVLGTPPPSVDPSPSIGG